MKKIIFVFVSAVILVVFILSCNKNFLNTQPMDKISSEATWADGPLSQAFIYGVYSFLGYGGFEEQALSLPIPMKQCLPMREEISRYLLREQKLHPISHGSATHIVGIECTWPFGRPMSPFKDFQDQHLPIMSSEIDFWVKLIFLEPIIISNC